MKITIEIKFKASALKVLNNAKSVFAKNGKDLSYEILDDNPLNKSITINVFPDEYAKYVMPKLDNFKKSDNFDGENKLRSMIRECLKEHFMK